MPSAGSPLLEVDATRAERLVDFAARLRGLHVRRAALHAGQRMLLLWGAPAILAVWLAPRAWWIGVGGLAGLAAIAALVAGWRARRIAAAALLRSGEGDAAALGVVGDELATWLEWSPQRSGTAMVAWLERDVDAQLPTLSPVALQGVGRRRFGRLLYLLPVLALLLLALLLSWWFQPPWPGVLGGAPEPPPPPPPRVESTPGPGDSSPSSAEPSPSPARDPEPTPAGSPPPSPDEPAPPPPPAEPPAPLLDLPGNQHFVLPEHIDDGPTRRMRMHAAELPEPQASAGAPPPSVAAGGTEPVPPPPPPAAEQFQRAAEQAARARHVPAAEQAMVRRFFDQLQKAAR